MIGYKNEFDQLYATADIHRSLARCRALLMSPNKCLTVISIFPMIIIKLVFIF